MWLACSNGRPSRSASSTCSMRMRRPTSARFWMLARYSRTSAKGCVCTGLFQQQLLPEASQGLPLLPLLYQEVDARDIWAQRAGSQKVRQNYTALTGCSKFCLRMLICIPVASCGLPSSAMEPWTTTAATWAAKSLFRCSNRCTHVCLCVGGQRMFHDRLKHGLMHMLAPECAWLLVRDRI